MSVYSLVQIPHLNQYMLTETAVERNSEILQYTQSWFLMCVFSSVLVMNALPHNSHLYGRSPVW